MICLAGGYYLPPDHPRRARLRGLAEMANPAAAKHARLVERGVVSPYAAAPPARVRAWQELPADHPWAGGTVLPRGLDLRATHDRRSDGEPLAAELRVRLRPYQSRALEDWHAIGQGTVVAPTGAGKTTLGLGAVEAVGRRALVLVHTLDLAEQWRARAADQLALAAGLVGDGAREGAAGLVVATVQTLARWPWAELYAWGRGFGLVVLDEAHHGVATSFCAVLGALSARYRLGLSATPDRDDGLGPLVDWIFGRRVTIRLADLVAAGAVVLPEIRRVQTGWMPSRDDLPWARAQAELTRDEARNALLLGEVRRLVEQGRSVLVLSERVAHCILLAEQLAATGVPAAAITGSLSATRRTALLAGMRDGSLRVLCGTSLADEGLDLPGLEAVVLATGTRALGRIQQRIGRTTRPSPGKRRPIVVDLVDAWGPLQAQAAARGRLYRRMGLGL